MEGLPPAWEGEGLGVRLGAWGLPLPDELGEPLKLGLGEGEAERHRVGVAEGEPVREKVALGEEEREGE